MWYFEQAQAQALADQSDRGHCGHEHAGGLQGVGPNDGGDAAMSGVGPNGA